VTSYADILNSNPVPEEPDDAPVNPDELSFQELQTFCLRFGISPHGEPMPTKKWTTKMAISYRRQSLIA